MPLWMRLRRKRQSGEQISLARSAPDMSEQIAVIYNPAACGGKALNKKKKVEACLNARGIGYDLFVTESEAHLVETARQAVEKYAVIVGVGGDTTINIIANEILRGKKRNILGIISQGSTNDLAKGIGVYKLEDACDAIAAGTSRPFDVGMITPVNTGEPYYFLAQASLGLGVAVNRYVGDWMKRHTFMKRFHGVAQTTSGLAAIYNSFKNRVVPLNLEMQYSSGTRMIESSLLVFNNTSYYAGRFEPSPFASPLDGKLDCCIFNAATFLKIVGTALQIKSMKHLENNKVEVLQDDKFKIHSSRPFDFQVDGEVLNSSGSIEVSVMPGALDVIMNQETWRP
jgi:diacylglycerol kinase (ATP)